ncbi:MAG TPA: hypothetical protein VHG29_03710 [Novosphingobium sp.]|nr:hypothetical protein [Novosphingobium sp.]
MNSVAQFIVEMTWGLTMALLMSAGVVVAIAVGAACAFGLCGTLCWRWWKRRR